MSFRFQNLATLLTLLFALTPPSYSSTNESLSPEESKACQELLGLGKFVATVDDRSQGIAFGNHSFYSAMGSLPEGTLAIPFESVLGYPHQDSDVAELLGQSVVGRIEIRDEHGQRTRYVRGIVQAARVIPLVPPNPKVSLAWPWGGQHSLKWT